MQEKVRKEAELRNLKKAKDAEIAYQRMMQANEDFKESTRHKVEDKLQKFNRRMKNRSAHTFRYIHPDVQGIKIPYHLFIANYSKSTKSSMSNLKNADSVSKISYYLSDFKSIKLNFTNRWIGSFHWPKTQQRQRDRPSKSPESWVPNKPRTCDWGKEKGQ